jgi:hypothetical protein
MTYTCCGRKSAHIDIDQGDSVLSFTMCAVCNGSSWIRDGQPVTLTAASNARLATRHAVSIAV